MFSTRENRLGRVRNKTNALRQPKTGRISPSLMVEPQQTSAYCGCFWPLGDLADANRTGRRRQVTARGRAWALIRSSPTYIISTQRALYYVRRGPLLTVSYYTAWRDQRHDLQSPWSDND